MSLKHFGKNISAKVTLSIENEKHVNFMIWERSYLNVDLQKNLDENTHLMLKLKKNGKSPLKMRFK